VKVRWSKELDVASVESTEATRVITLHHASSEAVESALQSIVGDNVQFSRTNTTSKSDEPGNAVQAMPAFGQGMGGDAAVIRRISRRRRFPAAAVFPVVAVSKVVVAAAKVAPTQPAAEVKDHAAEAEEERVTVEEIAAAVDRKVASPSKIARTSTLLVDGPDPISFSLAGSRGERCF